MFNPSNSIDIQRDVPSMIGEEIERLRAECDRILHLAPEADRHLVAPAADRTTEKKLDPSRRFPGSPKPSWRSCGH